MPQIKKVKQWVVEPDLPTGLYRHYKGGMYQVLGIGQHTETNSLYVVYVALDPEREGPRMRIRPLKMFQDFVPIPGREHVIQPRFEFMGNYFVIAEELEDNAYSD